MNEKEMNELETEEEFLENYDLNKYPTMAVAVDLAIFTIKNDKLCALLIKRGGHPEKGKWALPGGFVNQDESVDEAAQRELAEETGLKNMKYYLEQLKTYGSPNRDKRGYVVSIAYAALVPNMEEPEAGDDAAEAKFVPVDEIFADGFELAFDHRQIIIDGLERVRAKIEYSSIAPMFLNKEEFTISELRKVYETVWGVELNRSNFRRKVQSVQGFIVNVGKTATPEFDGGRCSDLYKAGNISNIFPPLKQPE